jgi:hypothetical protein
LLSVNIIIATTNGRTPGRANDGPPQKARSAPSSDPGCTHGWLNAEAGRSFLRRCEGEEFDRAGSPESSARQPPVHEQDARGAEVEPGGRDIRVRVAVPRALATFSSCSERAPAGKYSTSATRSGTGAPDGTAGDTPRRNLGAGLVGSEKEYVRGARLCLALPALRPNAVAATAFRALLVSPRRPERNATDSSHVH